MWDGGGVCVWERESEGDGRGYQIDGEEGRKDEGEDGIDVREREAVRWGGGVRAAGFGRTAIRRGGPACYYIH